MTSTKPQTRYVPPDAYDDPMGIAVTAQDPTQLLKTQRDSVVVMRRGLFAINGIDREAESAMDFFLGGLLGMALILEKAYYDATTVAAARLEATTDPLVMAKARRMVKGYRYAMDDAERSIKAGGVQQLELPLPLLPAVDLDW
jgi:hypothetical protein